MSEFFSSEMAEFAGLHLLTVKSNALGRRADITVFALAETASLKDVPLTILLHGVYGSHWAWTASGKAHETLRRLIDEGKCGPMILAMPSDGLYGDGSGYVPHRDADYEKWIVEDVIAAMKKQFPALGDESEIFIAGLSMGGFGAMRFGAKYPRTFRAFSGLSSITHFSQMKHFVSDFETLERDATVHDGVLDWMIANKAELPPFRFDCGRDDILIESNRELRDELERLDVRHEYFEYEGGHAWDYWETHLAETLLFFNRFTGRQ